MTVKDVLKLDGIRLGAGEAGLGRELSGVFCCDLLSLVIGRAPADCAWVTVIGNANTVAAALLADIACIVLAEGTQPDARMLEKAREHGIPVLCSALPVFQAALLIQKGLAS